MNALTPRESSHLSSVRQVLLLGATFNTGNMGVGALAAGGLAAIRASFPDAEISFLDYGRAPVEAKAEVAGKSIRVPLINLRFSWKLFLPNNVIFLLALAASTRFLNSAARRRVIRSNNWLSKIESADLALAVSGGDSFSDIYGWQRFLYIVFPQILAILLDRPIVLLPQTVGPFKGNLARLGASFVIEKAIAVYVREPGGVGELGRQFGTDKVNGKARFSYDMGFGINANLPALPFSRGIDITDLASRPLVGLNVSGLLLMGGYDHNNMFGLHVDYRRLIERILEYFCYERDVIVLLVPHVFGEHAENDLNAASLIYEDNKSAYGDRLAVVLRQYDQHEIKGIIGRCQFFIGSRMHACIAALSQAIPAVGIAYSDKFTGVFESVGVKELVVDPRDTPIQTIVEHIANRFDDRDGIRKKLAAVMPDVRNSCRSLLDEITL